MKLQQLRFFVEIVRQNNNISNAADVLCTSQSGISQQIKLLENELELALFVRKGRNLDGLTPEGDLIFQQATQILHKVNSIVDIANDCNGLNGVFTIATTHTQARYVLPKVVREFIDHYPNIQLTMHQGTPLQISELVVQGKADLAIATESLMNHEQLIALPCYKWGPCVIVQKHHPIALLKELTLQAIAENPIITYVQGLTGRYKIDEAFSRHDIKPNIIITAVDADVIKTYVRLGLGIGIIARMAVSKELDDDLIAIDVAAIFGISTTRIAFRKERYMRQYIYQFIEMFGPHLDQKVVNKAISINDPKERELLFENYKIPVL